MHWQLHKDGRADYDRANGRMEVAVALGLDPVTAYCASAPLPKHIDELMFAGLLRGDAVDVVKGVTVDLEVPAHAEIVLEGYVNRDELVEEGPFGDHTGYYTAAEPFPVFHVTAMTMRRDAVYPSIVVGKPPQEDAWLGKATERIFLPAVRATVPEIVDYDLPVAGAFHNCCIVSIRKAYPGHARKVMHAIWGLGMLSLTKAVIVVDGHVDHATVRQFLSGKLGIDATVKTAAEGGREWPTEIAMSDEVRALVDGRWAEYGIETAGPPRATPIRHSSTKLLRQ
jgi:4-hydroxy-3-polyprenylbenzoate decarboxylase